jgi:hypothetical protein
MAERLQMPFPTLTRQPATIAITIVHGEPARGTFLAKMTASPMRFLASHRVTSPFRLESR